TRSPRSRAMTTPSLRRSPTSASTPSACRRGSDVKGDTPPFQMDIVDGKLIPASAWDAERLATYRPRLDARGNLIAPRVNVVITQEVASWARRRYWAILGVVVKTCQLPPRVRTAQDLHDAVRKQIGFVDSHSSDGKTLTV